MPQHHLPDLLMSSVAKVNPTDERPRKYDDIGDQAPEGFARADAPVGKPDDAHGQRDPQTDNTHDAPPQQHPSPTRDTDSDFRRDLSEHVGGYDAGPMR